MEGVHDKKKWLQLTFRFAMVPALIDYCSNVTFSDILQSHHKHQYKRVKAGHDPKTMSVIFMSTVLQKQCRKPIYHKLA